MFGWRNGSIVIRQSTNLMQNSSNGLYTRDLLHGWLLAAGGGGGGNKMCCCSRVITENWRLYFDLQHCVWIVALTWSLSFAYYTSIVLPYSAFDFRFVFLLLLLLLLGAVNLIFFKEKDAHHHWFIEFVARRDWVVVNRRQWRAFWCWWAPVSSTFRRPWLCSTCTAPFSTRPGRRRRRRRDTSNAPPITATTASSKKSTILKAINTAMYILPSSSLPLLIRKTRLFFSWRYFQLKVEESVTRAVATMSLAFVINCTPWIIKQIIVSCLNNEVLYLLNLTHKTRNGWLELDN